MPKLLSARPPADQTEARTLRKLAGARHAPGDWIQRARMITASWAGARTSQIAAELGCHPATVRERIHRFNTQGIHGLGDRPGAGHPRRLTEHQRSQIIALVATAPPGRLDLLCEAPVAPPTDQPPVWTLDTLTAAAQAAGIRVGRSQVRRILLREGCAGGGRGPGQPAPTLTLSQKGRDRGPVHQPTTPNHGDLR